MSDYAMIPVVSYFIRDEYGVIHRANNPRSLDDTDALLIELREQNPLTQFKMIAEIDA